MASYQAGSASVSIGPNLKGFGTKLKAELKRVNAELGVRLTPDMSQFATRLARDLRSIRASIEVDVHPNMQRLNEELQRAARGRIRVEVEGDLTRIRQQLASLDGHTVTVDVNADTAAAQAQILAIRGGSVDVDVDVDGSGISALTRTLSEMTSSVTSSLGGIEGALGGIGGPARSAGSSIGSIGPAALAMAAIAIPAITTIGAALTGLVGAAGAAAGALGGIGIAGVVGMHGVGDALKAMGKSATDSGADTAAAAKAIESAQAGVVAAQDRVADSSDNVRKAHQAVGDAQREVKSRTLDLSDAQKDLKDAQDDAQRAQEKLNKSWKDATRELRDMNTELKDAKLSQEDAALSVREAKVDRAKTYSDPESTRLDKDRADLRLKQSQQRLKESSTDLQDKSRDTSAANAKGVAGSDQVKDATRARDDAKAGVGDAERGVSNAQQALADANLKVAESQRDVTRAQRDALRAQQDLTRAQNNLATAGTSAASGTDAYAEALAKLSPNAQNFVETIKSLKPAWDELKNAVQDRLFDGLGDSVSKFVNHNLGGMKSTLGSIADYLNTTFKSTLDGVSATFDKMTANGTLDKFLSGIKGMLEGIAPLISGVTEGLMTMTGEAGSSFGPLMASIGDMFRELGPSLGAIGREFIVMLTEMMPQLTSIIKTMAEEFLPLLPLISDGFKEWAPIIETLLRAMTVMTAGVLAVGAAFAWAWNAIGDAVSWCWENILKPIWENAIQPALKKLGEWFTWLWQNIILPVWNWIGSHISSIWNNVIKPVWDTLKNALSKVGDVFSNIWNNVIKPVWETLGNIIRNVWENFIRPTFDLLKTALGKVGDMFSTVAKGIGDAWAKIKDFAAKPISFVVNTVWNNGLRKVWDKIDDFLPIPKAPAPLAVPFADGGSVGMTPGAKKGKDSVNALLMPDEHVWNVNDVRKSGGQGAQYRMRNMIESGKPFTWTPNGLADASEGGPLMRFKDGGSVEAGQPLAPLGGEGGLKPIAVLMRRLMFKLWPKINDIGGYRANDPYPEHPSGRALDVMTPDLKTGDEVNGWVHANSKKFPIEHTLWKQKFRPQGDPNGSPMEDRGSPTQNHMDHVHAWYKEQAANPDKVPEGLVGFDGMTPEDKRSWLQKKVEEIIEKMGKGIKSLIGDTYGGKEGSFLQIPGAFFDKSFGAMLEKVTGIIKTLSDPGKWYDMGKNLVKDVLTSIPVVGGLFRDSGGYLPTGQSVVTNETGKPEAVLNWAQLQSVIKLMEQGSTLSDALGEVKPAKTDMEEVPEHGVSFGPEASLDDVKRAAEQIKEVDKERLEAEKKKGTGTPTPDTGTPAAPDTAVTPENQDQALAGSISENFGNAAKAAVTGQVSDILGVFGIPDSPHLLTAYNKYQEEMRGAKEGSEGSGTGTEDPSGGSGIGDYQPDGGGSADDLDPSDKIGFRNEKSKVPDVSEGPDHKYNPSGGAEQWRGMAEWAIDYVKRTLSGPAQTQAMVEQIGDESGGNPRAVNNYDINAQNGVPSGGLLQVIEPTFQANRDPKLPNDKFDPAANLVAALRYYSGRYGKDLTSRWGHGKGGYATGGYVSGPGTGTSDSIYTRLSNGEFVVNAKSTRRNLPLLKALNDGGTPVAAGATRRGVSITNNVTVSNERSQMRELEKRNKSAQRQYGGARV